MDDIKMAELSFFLLAVTMVNIQNAGCSFAKSSHFPHSENSKIPQWSDAKTNIRSGTAPVRLHVCEVTAPALQVSYDVSNVMQLNVLI